MRTLFLAVSALSVAALASCNLNKHGDYTPEYLKETSALDAPGTAAARAALRAKLVKEGTFADGETLDVQQGKVYLFDRNPDNDGSARGRMVESATAKIVACEGLYYFVELEDGSKGFLRESDLVNPVHLVSTSDLTPLEGGLPEGWENMNMGPQPEEVQLDGSQKLMTNEAGRTVVVVSKKSDRNAEFEARKKAIMEGGEQKTDLPTPTEELPEPAGSAE